MMSDNYGDDFDTGDWVEQLTLLVLLSIIIVPSVIIIMAVAL